MAMTPVSSIKLRAVSVGASRSTVTNGEMQFVDMGDHVIINGLRYSPDLSVCYGTQADNAGCGLVMRAPKVSFYSVGTAYPDRQYNPYIIFPPVQGEPFVKTSSGVRITPQSNMYDVLNPTGYISFDPATSTTSMVGTLSTGFAYVHGAIVRGSEYWFVGGASGATGYVTMQRFDANGAPIGSQVTGAQVYTTSTGGRWGTKIVPISDGVMCLVSQTNNQSPTVITGFDSSGYTGGTPITVSGANSDVRPAYVPYDVGKFYHVHLTQSATNHHIKAVTVASRAGVSTPSVANCTADLSPFADQNIPTASGVDIDYRINAELMTINGTRYLVVLCYAWRDYPLDTYNNPSKLVAYQIDANDPTKLTLVAQQTITRACMTIFQGNRIYTGRKNAVDVYDFNGSTFSYVDTFNNVDARGLIMTEAGTLLAVHGQKLTATCLVGTSKTVINCRFSQQSLKLTGNQSQTATLLLDVTDSNGTRLALDVDLLIKGGLFSNGLNTARVTTNATQTLSVPVTISSSGAVSVVPTLVN